jgi:hypothetical protein
VLCHNEKMLISMVEQAKVNRCASRHIRDALQQDYFRAISRFYVETFPSHSNWKN